MDNCIEVVRAVVVKGLGMRVMAMNTGLLMSAEVE